MQIIKPPRLEAGAAIGLVSLASPISHQDKKEQYHRGCEYLSAKGFALIEGLHVHQANGYLAGDDDQRAADFNDMVANKQSQALFNTRGGYGCVRLLDKIDYDLLAKHPKIILGYSDICVLQLAIYQKIGLVTFSGPMVAADMGRAMPPLTERSLWNQLMSTQPEPMVSSQTGYSPWTLHGGQADGILFPVCLSVLCSIIGTRFLPDMEGAILILEDIGEPLYKIDRYLAQLLHAGILDKINGLVLGQFSSYESDSSENDASAQLLKVYEKYITSLNKPILANFAYGHVDIRFTLPVGLPVHLDADRATFTFDEAGVKDDLIV